MDQFNTGVYRVSGTLDQFNGLTQIVPNEIQFESTLTTPLEPAVVTQLNEESESNWIQMENMRIVNVADWTTGTGGGGFNVVFEDEQGNDFSIRVDADVPLFNQSYPFDENTRVRLTGIGGQFDRDEPFNSGYQMLVYELEMMSHSEDFTQSKLKVYPTVCKEQVFINAPVSANFEVVNTQGVAVKKGHLFQGHSAVNLSGLHRGWFFLRIQLNHGVEVKKIFVAK